MYMEFHYINHLVYSLFSSKLTNHRQFMVMLCDLLSALRDIHKQDINWRYGEIKPKEPN